MNNSEKLKSKIRRIAKSKNLNPNELLQMFLFERIIERISLSPYKDLFILKGGLLIASIIGVFQRTTIDMDCTLKGIPVNEEQISKLLNEVLSIGVNDGITYELKKLIPINEESEYKNYRAKINARYGVINAPMKIDLTVGDEITPKELDYTYNLNFENKVITIKAYPLETILAEKYETLLRRNVFNTRSKDLYDIYILYKIKRQNISFATLKEALIRTAKRRHSLNLLSESQSILEGIKQSDYQRKLWKNFVRTNTYCKNKSYEEVLSVIAKIDELINKTK
ncbi:MAG: nucleotidyl transferase AbiEii/AbiGii toxin family protein [Kosmotoga sp.]|nr:MAG: nucleotidyl transferase AbiEii/AbiGii toxin family protein [Kosmotoga sp.]